MRDLSVTLVQTDLFWEDKHRNLEKFDGLLKGIAESPDVILLPEMFNTGFSMNAARLAETMDGPTVGWMAAAAARKGCVVAGSVIIRESGRFTNRFIWMRADGTHDHYDKSHLFRMAGEHEVFTAGARRVTVGLAGWSVRPLICYDLRFPVWSRSRGDTDVLVYVANWPQARRSAWNALLPARAIENQCYVVGVNRIGRDGRGIVYSGDSAVFDPRGERLSRTESHTESIETLVLSFKNMLEFRGHFQVFRDADEFRILNRRRKPSAKRTV